MRCTMNHHAIVTALILVALPGVAEAQSHAIGPDDSGRTAIFVGAGVAYAAVEVPMLSMLTYRAIEGSGFRPGWAITEIVWGSLHATYAPLMIISSLDNDNTNGEMVALGIAVGALGLFHVGHGIYSLIRGGPGRVEVDPEPGLSRDAAAGEGGVSLTLSGPTPDFF